MTDRVLPLRGAANPSSRREGTNPGSFSNPSAVGAPLGFSSPDTPGMPLPSDRSAWDFLPVGFRRAGSHAAAPQDFSAVTQLEHARLGVVTPEMRRVAEREPHLTAEQIRDEVAAGRMIIPANRVHLSYELDPMGI